MISREEAYKFLEKNEIKNHKKKVIKRINKLPKKLQYFALLITNNAKFKNVNSYYQDDERKKEIKKL